MNKYALYYFIPITYYYIVGTIVRWLFGQIQPESTTVYTWDQELNEEMGYSIWTR